MGRQSQDPGNLTRTVDVEALLSAVRTLIAARTNAVGDLFVLTEEQRVSAAADPETAPDADGYVQSERSAVLRDFAQLTLAERAAQEPWAAANGQAEPTETAPALSGTDPEPAEPEDLAALRALVREVLRNEVRSRFAHRIHEDIRQIVREELDARLDPSVPRG